MQRQRNINTCAVFTAQVDFVLFACSDRSEDYFNIPANDPLFNRLCLQ